MDGRYFNAGAELFLRMDPQLQNAFFTCYKTYGKVATKKLISCFQDPIAIKSAARVIEALENRYSIPPPPKMFQCTGEEGLSWLGEMPVGAGVSPCVNNTCLQLLRSGKTINTLDFFQELCGTAVEPARMIQSLEVDVVKLIRWVD